MPLHFLLAFYQALPAALFLLPVLLVLLATYHMRSDPVRRTLFKDEMAAKGSSTESPKVQPTSSGVAEPAPLNTQATDPKFAHLYDLNSDDNSEDVGPPSAKTGGNRKGKQRAESPETVGVGDGEVLPVGVGDEEVVLVEDYLDTDERPVSKERMTVDHVTEDVGRSNRT